MSEQEKALAELREALIEAIAPKDVEDIVEWLEHNVNAIRYSPIPGPFRVSQTPWLAEVLRACVDPEINLVCIQAPIQSGKSLVLELLTAYLVAKAPGPILALRDTDPLARDWMQTRLRVLWSEIPEVMRRLPNGHDGRSDTIMFDQCTMWCAGAYNKKNLQGKSIRYVIGDECWLWPKGHIEEASARVAFYRWLAKRIFASQGGHEGDDFTELFRTTDQRELTFACPSCNFRQPYKWENIIYPEEAKTGEGWDYGILRANTTLQCESCKTRFRDTDATRAELNKTVKFVAMNGNAAPSSVGFHWNALCVRPWGELAETCARASHAITYLGDEEPRKIFKQKQLALPWSEEPEAIVGEITPGEYKMQEQWSEEACWDTDTNGLCDYVEGKNLIPVRTMGVDVQHNGFYIVVRTWNLKGHSRLYYWAFVQGWEDVAQVAEKCNVSPRLVMVDCGDRAEVVHRMCAKYGWLALRGTNQTEFAHTVKVGADYARVMRPYSPNEFVNLGGMSRVAKFGNLPLKDMLFRLRRAKVHTFPKDCGNEYIQQMGSEFRAKTKAGKPEWRRLSKRANHIWDCEVMALVPALILKLIGKEAENRDAPEEEATSQDATLGDPQPEPVQIPQGLPQPRRQTLRENPLG